MRSNGQTVAIIAARGNSKGIPKKNLYPFCGRPLLYWTIRQCLNAESIQSTWVTSDSKEILDYAVSLGAKAICRPPEFSTDTATSESAWIHAIEHIEKQSISVSRVVALQATSPIRTSADLNEALDLFRKSQFDSLFSSSLLEDFCIWQEAQSSTLKSLNFDFQNRKRRQDHTDQYWLENGSFYIFSPEGLRTHLNRLYGKIGVFKMPMWKSFEIDSFEGMEFCELLMKHYILKENS